MKKAKIGDWVEPLNGSRPFKVTSITLRGDDGETARVELVKRLDPSLVELYEQEEEQNEYAVWWSSRERT